MSTDPMFLTYMRTKHINAERVGDDHLKVSTAVMDTFFTGQVTLMVSLPELEITLIEGQITRSLNEECQQAIPILEKMVGIPIRPGLTKKVDSLIGAADGCTNMANLILECCHAAMEGANPRHGLYNVSERLNTTQHRAHQQIDCIVRRNRRSPQEGVQPQETTQPLRRFETDPPLAMRSKVKFIGVGRLDEKTFRFQSTAEDRGHSLAVEAEVKLPRFEIISIRGRMSRAPTEACQQAIPILQNAIGIRIERGLTAMIDQAVGRAGCPRLGNLLLEGCHAILQATACTVLEDYGEKGHVPSRDEFRKRWLESMPIMRNTCLAYNDNGLFTQRLKVNWK